MAQRIINATSVVYDQSQYAEPAAPITMTATLIPNGIRLNFASADERVNTMPISISTDNGVTYYEIFEIDGWRDFRDIFDDGIGPLQQGHTYFFKGVANWIAPE